MSMLNEYEGRRQLQAAGKYLLANQLAWGNAGNLSARIEGDRFLITASGTRLGDLSDDDFVECSLAGDQQISSGRRPSKEVPMHRAVYEMRPEVNAILHASPFYSTLIACSTIQLPADWFVEAMYYLERVERVPYVHPGSAALGEAVQARARSANILLLENHGVLVYDTTVSEALMGFHTLEMVCRMVITAQGAQIPLRSLPAESVSDFLANSGYRPRRNWPVEGGPA
jgi:3-dehydro-4-phosphotetronate decarboxylase